MAAKFSAGILLHRRSPEPQVLLGRLGGPFWAKKVSQNWSIPKGELESDESALAAARREFTEELGVPVPDVALHDLGSVTQRAGKQVQVFTAEAEIDLDAVVLGTFDMEWPPRSGRTQTFEELAEVRWVSVDEARGLLIAAQVEFLDRLQSWCSDTGR